jgi:spermidine synthase
MREASSQAGGRPKASLPLLWLLFVGSGAAALVYEVVWFQLLQLIIGSSAVSLGVLLGTFMGGMCLGSFLLPRIVGRNVHPLRAYAALELGIGLAALLLLWAAPGVNAAYAALGGASVVVRAIVAALCLLPPTVLMGATLPAIARWVEATPQGVAWLGYFYGGNIAGAVMGSLFAGLYLLRYYDVAIGTYAAAFVNVTIAAAAWRLAQRPAFAADTTSVAAIGPTAADTTATMTPPLESAPARAARRTAAKRARTMPPAATPASAAETMPHPRVYWVIAISGLTALSAQVVWTRLLSLLFGGTVYTFALILAVFLLGLGIGSTAGAAFSRRSADPGRALGWAQLLIGLAMVWAGYLLMASFPFEPVSVEVMSAPLRKYSLDLWRCAQVVLPAAVLWGASFPIALAALARPGEDPGRLVGGVYAANTLGAIAGSLGIGLFVVAELGSQRTQQILILLSVAAGLIMAGAAPRPRPAAAPRAITGRSWRLGTATIVVAVAAIAGAAWLPAVPGLLVAFGRFAPAWVGRSEITYVGEGLNAFVAVSKTPTGVLAYHNSGKVQAGSEGADMRLQRMLGHFSHLVPRQPKDVLVIGLGAGVTAGAVAIAPSVERVTIVEIEPLVPKSVAAYFGDYNYHVVDDPKVTMHIDDGRHYLLTTNRTFDVITSDPLDPWIKGAATLFTEEFFQTMRRHLNPGGVVTQFVQLYGSNSDAVKSEIGTFIKVFPHTLVFGNLAEGRGYDLVLVGQVEPMSIDVDALQARLDDPAHARVGTSLRDIGIASAIDLLGSYAGSAQDLEPWLRGAAINTDRNLRLQYLAGLTLNASEGAGIYLDMLKYARFPDRIFTGSPDSLQQLRERIARMSAVAP